MRYVIVGLGGIGSILVNFLSKYLNYKDNKPFSDQIILIDGDGYEEKNRNRQIFSNGMSDINKALAKFEELSEEYPKLLFLPYGMFLNKDNVINIIKDDDIVFLCVDNHVSRKVVSDYCETLKNILVISGGNELTDGTVQIFLKQDDKNITPSLTEYNIEIQNPQDKSPEDMSCEELANSAPQLLFANMGAAMLMLWSFYKLIEMGDNKKIPSIVYYDIPQLTALPKIRTPKTKN